MNDITLGVSIDKISPYYDDYHSIYLSHTSNQPMSSTDSSLLSEKLPIKSLKHMFPKCERNGLVHLNLIPHMKTFKQADTPVSNMQGGLAQVKVENGIQVVYNKNGGKVAVAHQYDRNKELTNHLYKRVS